MISQLHELCRQLLEKGDVQVVIGYGQTGDGPAYPVFITRPDDVSRLVWNDLCQANLTVYLKRKEIRSLGKPAIIVKGCDARTLVVLERESQIDRTQIVVIGMACHGVGRPPLRQCAACDVHTPQAVDHLVGEASAAPADATDRYAALETLLAKTPAERMAYWQAELARCVKCYACRQACPLCYCQRCVADKNRPTTIDTSATLKGNFAWHITRAFHLAGRCVGCGQCARACPAGIDLTLLNLATAAAAERDFAFRAGVDPQAEPILGAFSQQDREEFIR